MTARIRIEFVDARPARHWPCMTCGGASGKVSVLAEGVDPETGCLIRCCERCLRSGDVDARLDRWRRQLEAEAEFVGSLKGRLVVPSFSDWQAAVAPSTNVLRKPHCSRAPPRKAARDMADCSESKAARRRAKAAERQAWHKRMRRQGRRPVMLYLPDDVIEEAIIAGLIPPDQAADRRVVADRLGALFVAAVLPG